MRTGLLNLSLHRQAAVAVLLCVVCVQAAAQQTGVCTPAAQRPVAVDPRQPAVVIDSADRIAIDGSVQRVALPDTAHAEPGAAFVERR